MRDLLRKVAHASGMLVPVLTAACVLLVSVYAERVLRARLLRERQAMVRTAVETAQGVLAHYGDLQRRGEKSRADAQQGALQAIRALRYGHGDYFWIQDGRDLILHPILPQLEGKPLESFVDPTGKHFLVDAAKEVGGPERAGFVAYLWPRPGSSTPVRKLSYVRLFEPWGWIVGSGTYLDDMDATQTGDARRVYTAALVVAALLVAGSLGAARSRKRSRDLELELQQARKLEAVGQLAAGIAHEINTPLQFIGDNTRFLADAYADYARLLAAHADAARPEMREGLGQLEEEVDLAYLQDQIPKTIDRTLQGVQRVVTIVRAMKEFAHPDQKEMVATDLNHAIQATLEVARNEYKYVADVETDYGEIPAITCHPGDLNQVFLNLIVNAAHAIGDAVKGTSAKGRIRVSTREEGPDVVVTIADSGTGIPEAIRDKIFDPFFTTKEVGRGTGQGLAIARNIVRKHRGTISFDTRPGQGTTFFIRLPKEAARRERAEAA